ncbi:hypothetical protein Tco_0311904 [Tanacetum coccineum]
MPAGCETFIHMFHDCVDWEGINDSQHPRMFQGLGPTRTTRLVTVGIQQTSSGFLVSHGLHQADQGPGSSLAFVLGPTFFSKPQKHFIQQTHLASGVAPTTQHRLARLVWGRIINYLPSGGKVWILILLRFAVLVIRLLECGLGSVGFDCLLVLVIGCCLAKLLLLWGAVESDHSLLFFTRKLPHRQMKWGLRLIDFAYAPPWLDIVVSSEVFDKFMTFLLITQLIDKLEQRIRSPEEEKNGPDAQLMRGNIFHLVRTGYGAISGCMYKAQTLYPHIYNHIKATIAEGVVRMRQMPLKRANGTLVVTVIEGMRFDPIMTAIYGCQPGIPERSSSSFVLAPTY